MVPGEIAPSEGDWTTLVFLPGVHDIGLNFRLHANRFPSHVQQIFARSYYIPGDAIVYGTMNNHYYGGNDGREPHDPDGENIRLKGLILIFSTLGYPEDYLNLPIDICSFGDRIFG